MSSPDVPPDAPSLDPLVEALHEENARLRGQNELLADQIRQLRQAQEELAGHLRLTAPLRRVQERLRLARTNRRRAHQPPGQSPATPAGTPADWTRAALLGLPPARAATHPLLARTRDDLTGAARLPQADLRQTVTGRGGRVAVVVHVYYAELWPELAERIERIPAPVDLVVTLVEGRSEGLGDAIAAQFPDVRLLVVPNRGRDMWPFVRVLQLGLVGDQDAVLKLHTKASVHRVDGAAWRSRILNSLCPSPERVSLTLDLLRRDPGVGMVAPAGAVLGREFWGANGPLVDALATRTGVAVDPEVTWFPGGSMFWARPGVVLRLRDAKLTEDDFEIEGVSLDGTTAHALERFVGALAADAGCDVVGSDEVAGRLAQARAGLGRPPPGDDDPSQSVRPAPPSLPGGPDAH